MINEALERQLKALPRDKFSNSILVLAFIGVMAIGFIAGKATCCTEVEPTAENYAVEINGQRI